MIFAFSLIEILPNFVEAFVLDWLLGYIKLTCNSYYPLCFKKQTPDLLLYLPFKVELSTKGLQSISFSFLERIQTRKKCCETIGPSLVI